MALLAPSDDVLPQISADRERASDEDLFKEAPPMDECPICMLPLPLDFLGINYQACCGKDLCGGCMYTL